ncbi:MAG: single-stranded-DNA-specific exonuclease RecJ [Ignavibacteriales bacterium]|nr:MAG: single-stranded-DNA-specific exonuclease RecJ [Ignavibacteriaceae bacterium]MBW7873822.1 single-stranded-DNA-specific exonuclease RecJ [Ignavibacteria bacterium]MCZ2144159.1 single-stranded-DNA-specific exonuclease RecJ [Ignavibacteriales bacterium]OQY77594.1 MAG: single-stranded-DNA-specific exonuclease RecJ [Ignavibacteriales bacterium UTCHB3]MBV6445798.1 Single-stranded-DNA-specific exonuclease RecJ [Ignavibacteriaceae bacterium]
MLTKQWKIRPVRDELEVRLLADSLNISEVLAKLLIHRNIRTFPQAKYFFKPDLEGLHSPFLMYGMRTAARRVIKAITSNEKILVYGDYDVDGTCSTALMFMFLKELGANVQFFIPNRLRDGYGITNSSIDYVHEMGATLMISVDCGITAVEETEYAKSLGIQMIICDHHQPGEVLPEALAVLDPLQPNCNYPFKYLSGAGVAFKLAQAVAALIGNQQLPMKYLDLVAMAGAADIVPLIDENRILVMYGLELINKAPRPGLLALMRSTRIEPGQLNAGQVVFSIAPRINAAGRLSDAGIAVEILMTDDYKRAEELSKMLESENIERRKLDEETMNSALEEVLRVHDLEQDMALVLHEEEWHPGVIGIVASRLVELYYRPTVMLTTIDGVAKGSARSIPTFNIYEALQQCADLLNHYGGHQAAAGLSIDIENIPEFRRRFNKFAREKITDDDLVPQIEIDAKIKLSEITPKFLRVLHQFAPFGPDNPRPVFLSQGVVSSGFVKKVGHNHLLLQLRQNGSEKIFDAIGFDLGHLEAKVRDRGAKFDLVYTIENTGKDCKPHPQLRIKDIKIYSSSSSSSSFSADKEGEVLTGNGGGIGAGDLSDNSGGNGAGNILNSGDED